MRIGMLTACLTLVFAACGAGQSRTGDRGPVTASPPGASSTPERLARSAAWQQDLEVLLSRVRNIHPAPFARMTEAEVDAEGRALARAIPALSDEAIVLGMMRLMARMTGGHTQLYGATARTIAPSWYPIRLRPFSDGIAVTAAASEHADLAGAQVLRIGELDAQAALDEVMRITPADNDWGRLHRAPYFLMMDWVLSGLGITPLKGELSLVVVGPADRPERTVVLRAVGASPDDDLSYTSKESVAGGAAALGRPTAPAAVPLHLRNPQESLWAEFLPASRTVYAQLERIGSDHDESLGEFSAQLWALVDSVAAERLVLDLRYARGGNKNLARPLLHGILARPHLNQPGRLFTIIGRETFSAGMMVAMFMEEHTNTLFVGEPTGASPNFASETLGINLPNSGLIASVAEWYWVNSVPWDTRAWLEPDVTAAPTIAEYRGGSDPAMDFVLGSGRDIAMLADSVLELRRRGLNRVKLTHHAIMRDVAAGKPVTELELRDIGRALVGSGDYGMGIELLSAWVAGFPASVDARLARGAAYLEAGDTARASTDVRQALVLDPGNERAEELLRAIGGRR